MGETVSYRERGLSAYGDKCEICGHSSTEVHHISYQEHNEMEVKIRKAKDHDAYLALLEEAKKQGYLVYDVRSKQLEKDNRSTNLSVLCGNCHTLMHKMDVGLKLLKALSPRK